MLNAYVYQKARMGSYMQFMTTDILIFLKLKKADRSGDSTV
uniref:Uncharacterized protein n=1 Tax=Anguilla anguilla TaxID=7936 RepID=A0A0E9UHF8_ANGAN